MKKLLFTLGLISFASLSLSAPVFANYGQYGQGCTPTYGNYGQLSCGSGTLLINKTVQNPITNKFVDNLTASTVVFVPNQKVNFQINVTNSGSAPLNNVVITDNLPSYVSFASSNGSYNSSTRTISVNVGQLTPGQSQTYSVAATINDASQIPADTTCEMNQATATADGQPQQNDTALFCMQQSVLGATTKGGLNIYATPNAKKTPGTGPDALSLLALIPAAFAGLKLRKNADRV